MVLQEQTKLPVWGWAAPGEKVTVTFAGQTATATAAADGTWRVDLPPVPSGDEGQVLTVAGKNTLTFQDVLVGDVWIASGQSNMEFGIANDSRAAETLPKANDPRLRFFFVPKFTAFDPQTDIAPDPKDPFSAKWLVCTPENLGGPDVKNSFSAVAYYFARELRKTTGRPVGVIGTYWGDTAASAWTSLSGLRKNPAMARYVRDQRKLVANFPQAKAAYAQKKAAYDTALTQWNATVGNVYNAALKEWQAAAAQAQAAGQPVPAQPKPVSERPKEIELPDGGRHGPANLYNGMVAPLIPYAIKGAIWYQGEANADGLSKEYAALFPLMINDWRDKWAQGDFPFLYVQLANYRSENQWVWVREAQLKTLSLPGTGMAVAIDVGDPFNIHPKDKLDVGHRLALAARHVAYGEDIVYSGPIYDSMTTEGGKLRVAFKNCGSGLIVGTSPLAPKDNPAPAPTELTGFTIAGTDQKFVAAKAVIDGNSVVVSSDQVPAPAAVRYDWADSPPCDFYNKEGLPASPFRTDTWEK